MSFKYRNSNGKVVSKADLMVDIASVVYPLKKDGGADLRYAPTFEFIPDENPRVTSVAEFDTRYAPTGVTTNGNLDRRFKSNRLVLSLNGAGEIEAENA
jgi:hypothetical protein